MDYEVVYVNPETKKRLEELKVKYSADSLDAVIQILLVNK